MFGHHYFCRLNNQKHMFVNTQIHIHIRACGDFFLHFQPENDLLNSSAHNEMQTHKNFLFSVSEEQFQVVSDIFVRTYAM